MRENRFCPRLVISPMAQSAAPRRERLNRPKNRGYFALIIPERSILLNRLGDEVRGTADRARQRTGPIVATLLSPAFAPFAPRSRAVPPIMPQPLPLLHLRQQLLSELLATQAPTMADQLIIPRFVRRTPFSRISSKR